MRVMSLALSFHPSDVFFLQSSTTLLAVPARSLGMNVSLNDLPASSNLEQSKVKLVANRASHIRSRLSPSFLTNLPILPSSARSIEDFHNALSSLKLQEPPT